MDHNIQLAIAGPRSFQPAYVRLMQLRTVQRRDGDNWYVKCSDGCSSVGRFRRREDAEREFTEHVEVHNGTGPRPPVFPGWIEGYR